MISRLSSLQLSRRVILSTAFLTIGLMTGCGKSNLSNSLQSSSPENADFLGGDVFTINISDEMRPKILDLLSKLQAAKDKGSPLLVKELVSAVPLSDESVQKIGNAYSAPLAVVCQSTGTCDANGNGSAVRVPTIPVAEEMNDVDLGLNSSVSANYLMITPKVRANICNVNGVYFQKWFFKKNLGAVEIDMTNGGTIKVFLANAAGMPNC